MESLPPITWTESGQTPALTESSSSRESRSSGAGPGRLSRGVVGIALDQGHDHDASLDASASKVAGAAADALSDTLGVRSTRGVVVRDRGRLVAKLSAVVEPECDLAAVAQRADAVSAQLAQVLERDDIRCRVQLRVASRGGRMPRVG